jgi:parallel beta-helix repeat protein
VWSGTYPGTVKIDKKITLIGTDTGAGAPVIDPGNKGTAIEIDADGCTVEGFTIQNSVTANGILVTSNENTIANNTLTGNAVGIQLSSADSNSVTGNSITGSNRAGIALKNAKNNVIEGNRVTNNAVGITIDELSGSNTISFNTFSNTENVLSRDASQQWESPSALSYSYLGKSFTARLGNYWSDYRGSDQNSDGIGDSPYVVGSGLIRTTGIAAARDDVDPAPLMDPIDYYLQVRPAVSGTGTIPVPTTPLISATAGTGTPSGNTGSPSTVDRANRGLVTIIILILLVCIIGAGGVLFIRSRTNRRDRTPNAPVSPGDTRPRPVLDLHENKESTEDNRQPSEPGPKETTPTPVTEVAPAPRETPPSSGPKFYFPPELENRYTDIRHIGRGSPSVLTK